MNKNIKMSRVKNIHFVGIAGVGMSGIAEVLLTEGYCVSGSDLNETAVTKNLSQLGAKIYKGHHESHIVDADILVVSSAIADENPEYKEALVRKIPVVQRAQMLAELMRLRFGIAVAGTHGKTTTTSLVASILVEANLDPTFIIGGRLNSANSNAKLGKSEYLVAEADESDASFLHLNPNISIITNINPDHLENYNNDFEQVKKTFLDFIQRLPFDGLLVACVDNPVVEKMLPCAGRPTLTYGFSNSADVQIVNFVQRGLKTDFMLQRKGRGVIQLSLNMPGKHNVLNATAAAIVATELNVDDSLIQNALKHFLGVGRRFESLGQVTLGNKQCQIIDDYAHHPIELAATLQAAKSAWPDRRLVGVFQPHRFTRTRDLFDEFTDVLSEFDELILFDVYPAGEAHIVGADSQSLARNIRKRCPLDPVLISKPEDFASILSNVIADNDIVLTLGAGSISLMAHHLVKECSKQAEFNA